MEGELTKNCPLGVSECPVMDWRPVLGVALPAGSIPALVTPITAEQMDGLNLSEPLVC